MRAKASALSSRSVRRAGEGALRFASRRQAELENGRSALQMLIAILAGTPVWVWGLLAALIGLGLSRLRTRVTGVWRLAIVPMVFLLWGLSSLVIRSMSLPVVSLAWLAGFLVGGMIGWLTFRATGIDVDRRVRRLRMPGGASTLVVSMLVFAAKYVLAVSLAMHPQWAAPIAALDLAVSGLSAGFFVSRFVRLLQHYRQAPQVDLSA